MDEWYLDGKEADVTHPLSFEKADRELCFNRIDKKLRMPDSNMHFPKADTSKYITSWESGIRCAVMQGIGATQSTGHLMIRKGKENIKILITGRIQEADGQR
jgi:choline dehydrogenase-like flavoprotein